MCKNGRLDRDASLKVAPTTIATLYPTVVYRRRGEGSGTASMGSGGQ